MGSAAVKLAEAAESAPPMIAPPDVWRVPGVVLTTPTPRPPVKYPCPVVSPAAPPTENLVEGLVVPMPMLPELFQVKTDVPNVPTAVPYPRLHTLAALLETKP